MRRKRAVRRRITPDPKYNDILVARFINNLMKQGKKSRARQILYEAIDLVSERTKEDGYEVFKKALFNAQPQVEVRGRRIGGATYQVPMEVRPDRRTALAIRWLISFARARNDKSMARKLAAEFVAAANSEGGAIKKKDDTHRMAEANKAFAHFRW